MNCVEFFRCLLERIGTRRRWLGTSTAHTFTHRRASLWFFLSCEQEEKAHVQLALRVGVLGAVPSGEGEVRCEQLDMVIKWIGDFQAANRQPDEEVAFDVLCGDFNFDNCSPGWSITAFPSAVLAIACC